MPHPVYLDHNATSPIRPEAVSAVIEAVAVVGNPSSVHRFGRTARRVVEDAREQVALLVDADPSWVIFTSGGTEANSLALGATGCRTVLVSAVEHPSVGDCPAVSERIPVDGNGIVDLMALEAMLRTAQAPALVSVMLANNETGVLQPMAAIATLARRHGAIMHCDAVQAAGRLPLRIADLGAHLLSLSAHKLGGPSGVGALIADPALPFRPLLHGGGQERRRRAGTENVAGIAGFAAAAAAVRARGDAGPRLARIRDGIEREVLAACLSAHIIAVGAPRLPNTTCLTMPGVAAETQVMAFDLAGIAVSAGAACASGKVGRSHVLEAMGIGHDIARTAVRVSLGWTTTDDDAAAFVTAWQDIYRRSRIAAERGGPWLATNKTPPSPTPAVPPTGWKPEVIG